MAPEFDSSSYILKEVIKWIIAVLANGVVTRSQSRRAVTTSSATPLAITVESEQQPGG